EDERLELIGGDVVPMSPKGNHHEALKIALNMFWTPRVPLDLLLASETGFYLNEDTYVEPDFILYPAVVRHRGLNGPTAKLVVEIAASSLSYDLGRKAAIYAAFGIAELWVMHAINLETRIHREPTPTGYRSLADLPPSQRLVPSLIPALAVTLSELKLHY